MAFNSIHLFAGAGGGILADLLLGHRPIAACEIEKYPREVLLQRQKDGFLPEFPVWDDIRTLRSDNPECGAAFDKWRELRESLVLCGGFPCQNVSSAGKGGGITGTRSGLWKEYARIIGEIRPAFVFAENSPLLRTRGLGTVLKDLDGLGYDARWCVLGAGHVGAVHKRARMWVVAHADCTQRKRGWVSGRSRSEHANADLSSQWSEWWSAEPSVGRVGHGVAHRVDRLKATGNGQVPAVAATAWHILTHDIV